MKWVLLLVAAATLSACASVNNGMLGGRGPWDSANYGGAAPTHNIKALEQPAMY